MRFLIKHGYFLPRVYEILICIMMDCEHTINCIYICQTKKGDKVHEFIFTSLENRCELGVNMPRFGLITRFHPMAR